MSEGAQLAGLINECDIAVKSNSGGFYIIVIAPFLGPEENLAIAAVAGA
ncbi:MAG TPA: hypothetical protein VH206_16160 [Xanthobacteraceae bacterium]|nr:hypothetical protein [Xanthobacteraceae bacterium]